MQALVLLQEIQYAIRIDRDRVQILVRQSIPPRKEAVVEIVLEHVWHPTRVDIRQSGMRPYINSLHMLYSRGTKPC